jgi:hypothetical protein
LNPGKQQRRNSLKRSSLVILVRVVAIGCTPVAVRQLFLTLLSIASDFSQATIQKSIQVGLQKARQVLG